ncbi:MAG TPA: D-cysteine desulfhydrase family protein [Acidimicrobiales bacterium]|nr:D-cysteine desulfhydrase family protein [Acidimicrobiales bacterium]
MDGTGALERRSPLAHQPTPLESADRLGAWLGLPAGTLMVKRDDCTGLAGGGNKARKLEYLCADALAQGCDVLVTGGGRQSNHVRMTAAAANRLGLGCTVVLAGGRPRHATGNVVIDQLLGPEIIWAGDLGYYQTEAAIEEASARLASAGRHPYAIPVGGASVVGALGYVRAGHELVEQWPDLDVVVVADGSGGTHAGLAAALGDHARVLGVDVGTRPDLDERVPEKAAAAAELAGLAPPSGRCLVDHRHFGAGYGAPTPQTRLALDAAARLEGLVLDPVYTGKAMAGLIAAVGQGELRPGQRIVFLHTGGMPALFAAAYAEWVSAGVSPSSPAPPPAGSG